MAPPIAREIPPSAIFSSFLLDFRLEELHVLGGQRFQIVDRPLEKLANILLGSMA